MISGGFILIAFARLIVVLCTVILRLFSFVCEGFVFCGLGVLGCYVGFIVGCLFEILLYGYMLGNCGNFVFLGGFWLIEVGLGLGWFRFRLVGFLVLVFVGSLGLILCLVYLWLLVVSGFACCGLIVYIVVGVVLHALVCLR